MIRVAIINEVNIIKNQSFFVICLTFLFQRSMIFGIIR